ncbi:histone acetyltransferase [Aureococcus anophagefferens]|nr:histone acetyltransferase [Aureococcus anophagefferens]
MDGMDVTSVPPPPPPTPFLAPAPPAPVEESDPYVAELDLDAIRFELYAQGECASVVRDVDRSDPAALRVRSLLKLLSVYIPNIDAPDLLKTATYDAVAMVAPRRDDATVAELVGGSIFGGRASPEQEDGSVVKFVELALFAVEHACQGKKLGKKLMTEVQKHCRERHEAVGVLTYADFKAFSFFKRVGFSRTVTLPHTVWKTCIVHYEGAAVVEALLGDAAPVPTTGPAAKRVVPCTSGRPNCYCRSGRTRAIARYDKKTGAELEVYCSASDAARKLGLAACSVTHVTNGIAPCAQGHYFRYITEVPWLNSGSKAVVEMDGKEVVNEYKSANAAARELFGKGSRLNGSIGEVCNGYLDHVDGTVFRWAEPRIHPCDYCGTDASADDLLLCDGIDGRCTATAHTFCLGLAATPEGDWFCDSCEERKAAGWSMATAVPRSASRGYFKERLGAKPARVIEAEAAALERAAKASESGSEPLPEHTLLPGAGPEKKKPKGSKRKVLGDRDCDLCARSGADKVCGVCGFAACHKACCADAKRTWTCGVCSGDAPPSARALPPPPPAPPPVAPLQPKWEVPRGRPPVAAKADITSAKARMGVSAVPKLTCEGCGRTFATQQGRAAHLGNAPACRAFLGLQPTGDRRAIGGPSSRSRRRPRRPRPARPRGGTAPPHRGRRPPARRRPTTCTPRRAARARRNAAANARGQRRSAAPSPRAAPRAKAKASRTTAAPTRPSPAKAPRPPPAAPPPRAAPPPAAPRRALADAAAAGRRGGVKSLPAGPIAYLQQNPKKLESKSWARYEKYKRARDVAGFVALGGSRPDLLYDFRHGFVDGPNLAAWEGGLQAKAPKPKAGRTFVI